MTAEKRLPESSPDLSSIAPLAEMLYKDTIISKTNTQIVNEILEYGRHISVAELWKTDVTSIPLLFDLFPMAGIWFLIGASDTGKSMLLRQLALCVSGGLDFLGRKFNGKHKKAIIISTEDDAISFAVISRKQNITLRITTEDAERIYCFFDSMEVIEFVEKLLQTESFDLIILDAFSDLIGGKDINQSTQIRQFLQPFSTLAVKYEVSIGFLHHTGKRTESLTPSKNNAIGSQAIEAKARLVAELRLDKENPDLRHFCIVKGNYLPASEKQSSHVLRMDENLCFHATGERKLFEELGENSNGQQKKSETKPTSFPDKTHIDFLKEIFKPFDKAFSKSQLNARIRTRFYVSDQPAREFINHYERKGWIKCTEVNLTRTECTLTIDQGSLW